MRPTACSSTSPVLGQRRGQTVADPVAADVAPVGPARARLLQVPMTPGHGHVGVADEDMEHAAAVDHGGRAADRAGVLRLGAGRGPDAGPRGETAVGPLAPRRPLPADQVPRSGSAVARRPTSCARRSDVDCNDQMRGQGRAGVLIRVLLLAGLDRGAACLVGLCSGAPCMRGVRLALLSRRIGAPDPNFPCRGLGLRPDTACPPTTAKARSRPSGPGRSQSVVPTWRRFVLCDHPGRAASPPTVRSPQPTGSPHLRRSAQP